MKQNPEEDWRLERQLALSKEGWTDTGPKRVVKVVRPGTVLTEARGFILIGLSIVGQTPMGIGYAAGLPTRHYVDEAWIYKLTRKPAESELQFELTAKCPDGVAYQEGWSSPDYPPGDDTLHQWTIRKGHSISVLPDHLDLKPGQKFPYDWL
jgi:hypothetical protein